MTTPAAEALYLAQHRVRMEGRKYAVYNPHNKPIEDLPIIYGFNNGGSPGWLSAVLIAEDGVCLGGHICSAEGYMEHDLGILEGARPDRHEGFKKHFPNGYRMDFISSDRLKEHYGINRAFELNKKASQQRVTITGRIGSYATLASSPGFWYTSYEVTRAFNGNGNAAIWDPGAASGGWSSFFSQPSGSLARCVSQLILISEYQLTVTVHGQYTLSDVSQLKTLSTLGAWPLFASATPPTQKISFQRNKDSTVSVVHELDPGKIQIWGVTVQPAP